MSKQEWEFQSGDCAICGGKSLKFLGHRGGEAHRAGSGEKCRIVKCRQCHTIFPNPMPYPKGKDVRYSDVEDYFENVMRIDHDQHVEGGKLLLAEAEKYLGLKGSFLDVGCGRGEAVRAAKDLGWEAKGCDISDEYVNYAKDVNGVDAITGTLEQVNFPDDSFHFVSLVEVIEHLYDSKRTVEELCRVLKPGGILYVSTPNEESIYQTFGNLYYRLAGRDWVVNLCPTWDLYHIFGFSPRSLRYLLENNGFRIEQTVVYPGTFSVPRRESFGGKLEGIGVDLVEKTANLLGKSPFMYTWARKV